MKTAYFRRRSDGALLTEGQVKIAAKPNRSRVQVFLANDPDRWHPGVLRQLGLQRVAATPKPNVDERYYVLDGVHAEPGGETGWRQAWTVEPRYRTSAALKSAIIRDIKDKRDLVIDAGVVVNGVVVRTDATGRSLLALALARNTKARQFNSGEQSKELAPAEIEAVAKAVDDHIQGAYDKAAELMRKVKASRSPEKIDIDSGW